MIKKLFYGTGTNSFIFSPLHTLPNTHCYSIDEKWVGKKTLEKKEAKSESMNSGWVPEGYL